MPRKKRKIIREIDSRRFKEVKQEEEAESEETEDKEEIEESLEGEFQGQDILGSDFVEFLSGGSGVSAPILESTGGSQIAVAEPIEDSLQDVQTPRQAGQEARSMRADYEEAVVHNMPDYDAGIYEVERQEEMMRRDPERVSLPLIRLDEALASDTMRPVRMMSPEEAEMGMQGGGGRDPEDYVMRARQIEEERGLPFEKKRKRAA